MRRKAVMIALAVSALVGGAFAHEGRHPASAAQVAAALANPARADQATDDTRRHAAAIIGFTGAGPGSTVVDFMPGRGYWTRILSGVVGTTGQIYAYWPAWGAKYATKPLADLKTRNLTNVALEVLPTDTIATPKPADIVLTVQNYHDIPNDGRGEAAIDAFNKSVFAALKPGGVYIVIDHVDAAGTGLSGTSTKHRIDPAIVKAQVLKAGFTFAGESKALANPADDHSKGVFDPSIRGETDQFAYKFRKPVR